MCSYNVREAMEKLVTAPKYKKRASLPKREIPSSTTYTQKIDTKTESKSASDPIEIPTRPRG